MTEMGKINIVRWSWRSRSDHLLHLQITILIFKIRSWPCLHIASCLSCLYHGKCGLLSLVIDSILCRSHKIASEYHITWTQRCLPYATFKMKVILIFKIKITQKCDFQDEDQIIKIMWSWRSRSDYDLDLQDVIVPMCEYDYVHCTACKISRYFW